MGKFLISLDEYSVANQIASMINNNNKLKIKLSAPSILSKDINYFVEMSGVNIQTKDRNKIVMGCIGVENIGHNTIVLKHLSVHSEFRRLGIASKLIKDALKVCKGKIVIMRIRTDNKPSLYLAEKLGFVYKSHDNLVDYSILTVERRVSNDI